MCISYSGRLTPRCEGGKKKKTKISVCEEAKTEFPFPPHLRRHIPSDVVESEPVRSFNFPRVKKKKKKSRSVSWLCLASVKFSRAAATTTTRESNSESPFDGIAIPATANTKRKLFNGAMFLIKDNTCKQAGKGKHVITGNYRAGRRQVNHLTLLMRKPQSFRR